MAKQYAVGGQVKLVNRLVGFLNRFGLAGSKTFTLTTIGRRSGERRSTPVTISTLDGNRYLVAPYGAVGWVHNIRAAGTAELRQKGKTRTITASELGATEAGPVLKQYFEDIKIVRPYFDAGEGAGVDEFIAEAAKHPVFRIEK